MSAELRYHSNNNKLVSHIAFLSHTNYPKGPFVQVRGKTLELVKTFMEQSSVQEVKDLVTVRMQSLNRKQVDILQEHLQTLHVDFKEAVRTTKLFSETYKQLSGDIRLIKEMIDLAEERIDQLEVEANKRYFEAERAKYSNPKCEG